MLSKRNFVMMMTMIIVVLVLFLSSVALKEYFNDYDVNHAAETEIIEKRSTSLIRRGNRFYMLGRWRMVTIVPSKSGRNIATTPCGYSHL